MIAVMKSSSMLVAPPVSSSSFSYPREQHNVWDNRLATQVEGVTSINLQDLCRMSTCLNLVMMDLAVYIALPGRAGIFSILFVHDKPGGFNNIDSPFHAIVKIEHTKGEVRKNFCSDTHNIIKIVPRAVRLAGNT